MGRFALGAVILVLAAIGHSGAAAAPCPPQPMPPALDSVPPLPDARGSVSFSATPWEHPGRAWVIRAHHVRRGAGALEIVRLRRQNDCNRYDVEARWQAALPAADYGALVQAAAPLGTPRSDAFAHDDPVRDGEGLALDGTGIELRLKRRGWEARRELNHEGRGGAALSALFRALVAKHVPAAELPAEDWRTRRGDGDAEGR